MHAKHMADVNDFLKMELVARFLENGLKECANRMAQSGGESSTEPSDCVSYLLGFCLFVCSFHRLAAIFVGFFTLFTHDLVDDPNCHHESHTFNTGNCK